MTFIDPETGIFSLNYALRTEKPIQQKEGGSEGFDLTPQQIFERNKSFIKKGVSSFDTPLTPIEEQSFRVWLQQNNMKFDVNSETNDYDMRGFWKAIQSGDPRAKEAVDPNDNRMHQPDIWKTPYDLTFSNESIYAADHAPKWNNKDQLIDVSGNVLFDDKAHKYYPLSDEWHPHHIPRVQPVTKDRGQ